MSEQGFFGLKDLQDLVLFYTHVIHKNMDVW